jgi:hypothetical protein
MYALWTGRPPVVADDEPQADTNSATLRVVLQRFEFDGVVERVPCEAAMP